MRVHLRVVSGGNQTCIAGEWCKPFVIQALNENGDPIAGLDIDFTIGGRNYAGRVDGSTLHTKTDSRGMATRDGFMTVVPGTVYGFILVNDLRFIATDDNNWNTLHLEFQALTIEPLPKR